MKLSPSLKAIQILGVRNQRKHKKEERKEKPKRTLRSPLLFLEFLPLNDLWTSSSKDASWRRWMILSFSIFLFFSMLKEWFIFSQRLTRPIHPPSTFACFLFTWHQDEFNHIILSKRLKIVRVDKICRNGDLISPLVGKDLSREFRGEEVETRIQPDSCHQSDAWRAAEFGTGWFPTGF